MTIAYKIELLNAATPPIQNFIILSGVRSPGRATIVNAGSPRRWTKTEPYGASPILVYVGDNLSEFDVIIDIWEDSHWAEWNNFVKVLETSAGGIDFKALEISHPVLFRAPLRITQVVIRDVSQWEKSKTGLWSCRIAMTVWRGSKEGLGKPTGSIPSAKQPGIEAFETDPKIAELVGKARGLGGTAF